MYASTHAFIFYSVQSESVPRTDIRVSIEWSRVIEHLHFDHSPERTRCGRLILTNKTLTRPLINVSHLSITSVKLSLHAIEDAQKSNNVPFTLILHRNYRVTETML